MKLRFNKAAYFAGRVKYGYAQPLPSMSRSAPGAGAKRQFDRLYAKIDAHPAITEGPPSRQVRRAEARRAA